MRAIVCGDTHIGAVFGLGRPNGKGGNTRVDDYEKTLNHIVSYTIDTGADIFIQTGDIFEHRNPSVEHMSIVDKALKRLSNANVATFVIMGNHDYRKSGASFTSSIASLSASDYPNVRLLLEPEVVEVCNAKNEKVNLVLFPYRDRKMYKGSNSKEQSEEYDLHIKKTIESIENDNPTMFVGHNFFYEGSYNDYGGSEVMARPDAFEGCDVAMMGHLHQFRVLRKKAPVCIYTGSMEKTNFGDENVDKYFIDYNISNKSAKFCKTPTRQLTNAAIDLSGLNFSEISESLNSSMEELELRDRVVKVTVAVDEKVLPAIDKEYIESYLYDLGAFHVSKVSVEALIKRVVRDSSIMENKDDYSMFEAFIESQGIDKEYRQALLKEAKIIMGEV